MTQPKCIECGALIDEEHIPDPDEGYVPNEELQLCGGEGWVCLKCYDQIGEFTCDWCGAYILPEKRGQWHPDYDSEAICCSLECAKEAH